MSGARRIAILVAGMHRSGTSALTRVLTLAGADLPGTLVPARPDNVTGFWESQAVVDLNDEILASAGSSWDDWRPFDPDWGASPAGAGFRERAPEALRREFGDSRLFILKDPRICRLLPFWLEAVGALGARPLIVSVLRNPLDVGASLHVRNRIDPAVGHLAWLRHVLDAEAGSRGLTRVHVRYEQLLANAHGCVDRIGGALGLAWPRRLSPGAEMDIDGFLTPELAHHRGDDARLPANPRLSPWLGTTFAILDRWTRDDVRPDDAAELDRVRADFDAATPAFSRALAAGEAACRVLAERDAQIVERDARIAERDAQLAERDRQLAERDRRVAEQGAQIAGRDERIVEQDETIAERDRRIAGLKTGIRTLSAGLDDLQPRAALALARRERRLGLDRLEACVRPRPEWLASLRLRPGPPTAFELRRNGRKLARIALDAAGRGGSLVVPLGRRLPPLRRDTLYSLHEAASGAVLDTLAEPALLRSRRIRGTLESWPRPEVHGWLLDPVCPAHRRRVAIHLDGRIRAVVVAMESLGELGRARGTDGRHGFTWRLPAGPARRDGTRVEVFDAETGRPLSGSPGVVAGGQVVAGGRPPEPGGPAEAPP